MMDWPETRLRLQLWLFQSWPFRLVAWWLDKVIPQERGFGQFRAQTVAPTADQIRQARACIADAERPENSPLTQIDAAIQAIRVLDPSALADEDIQRYLRLKYERPLDALERFAYHGTALLLAKKLLSKVEPE